MFFPGLPVEMSVRTILGLKTDPSDQVDITFTGPVEALTMLKERLGHFAGFALKFGDITGDGDNGTMTATYELNEKHLKLEAPLLVENPVIFLEALSPTRTLYRPVWIEVRGQKKEALEACMRFLSSPRRDLGDVALRGASRWLYMPTIDGEAYQAKGVYYPEKLAAVPVPNID